MITINFKSLCASILSGCADEKTLKQSANSMVQDIQACFNERAKELTPATPVKNKKETKPTEKPTEKTESKASKAREFAAKMKGEKAEKPAEKPAEKKESKPAEPLIDVTDAKAIKKLGLTFEKYNEKCMVLRGDTKPLRKVLSELKGVYNSHLVGGEGWVFKNENAQVAAKQLKVKIA